MEGAISIGTIFDDEQPLLVTLKLVLHPFSGLNNLFFGPKCHRIILATTCLLACLLACCCRPRRSDQDTKWNTGSTNLGTQTPIKIEYWD